MSIKACAAALMIALLWPAAVSAGVCNDHADKLIDALKATQFTLRDTSGDSAIESWGCPVLQSNIDAVDDEMNFLDRHSCWPDDGSQRRMEAKNAELHREISAAQTRLHCGSKVPR